MQTNTNHRLSDFSAPLPTPKGNREEDFPPPRLPQILILNGYINSGGRSCKDRWLFGCHILHVAFLSDPFGSKNMNSPHFLLPTYLLSYLLLQCEQAPAAPLGIAPVCCFAAGAPV